MQYPYRSTDAWRNHYRRQKDDIDGICRVLRSERELVTAEGKRRKQREIVIESMSPTDARFPNPIFNRNDYLAIINFLGSNDRSDGFLEGWERFSRTVSSDLN
jgi:hypothetical protein